MAVSDANGGLSGCSREEIERVCMRNLIANRDERVFFKDRESRFLLVNASWLETVGRGRSLNEVVGKTDSDIFSGPHAAAALEDEQRVIETGEPLVAKVERETFTDRPDAWVSTTKLPLRDEQGNIVGTWGISRDVTDRTRAEERLAAVFESALDGIVIVDDAGQRVQVNSQVEKLFGYHRDELIGQRIEILVPDSLRDRHADDRAAFSADPELRPMHHTRPDLACRRKDGSEFPAEISLTPFETETGTLISSVIRDVTDRKRAEERLRHSERTLRSVIDHTPALVSVKGRDFRYQLVNREFEETFGVRSDWIVGRSDQELLPASVIDQVRAKDRLVLDDGQILQEEQTVLRDGRESVYLTIRFPLLDEHSEVQAVCTMSTDITERRVEERSRRERLECSELIHSALAENRFVLHGQPIVNLASMQVEASELLIRKLEVGGGQELVMPAEFLPAAERFDLIHVIDKWVIDSAIKLAAAGHHVAVNVSGITISDSAQVERIERAVIAGDACPQNLIFEITETAVAENLDAARIFAQRLCKLGCAFALDDFGVGHGTFTYLRHLPVEYLKIHQQFVQDLLRDEEARHVIRAIIGVARQFDMKVIAEGVEDQTTMVELRRIGVDYAQGYWIDRPMPLQQLWQQPKNRTGEDRAT